MEENIYDNHCFKCGNSFIAEGKMNTECPDCELEELYKTSVMADWTLIGNSDYFYIVKEKRDDRKTPILHIFSKKSNDEIGLIKWYGAWRKFCFFPNSETVWDEKCLDELNKFLIEYNEDWRRINAKN